MYEQHWQLDTKPFEHSVAESFYFPSEAHQGAMLKLRYAVESKRTAALLAGGSGLGKTLLVEVLRKRIGAEFSPTINLTFPQMPSEQLLAFIADELAFQQHRGETSPEGGASPDVASSPESAVELGESIADKGPKWSPDLGGAQAISTSIRRITEALRANRQKGKHAIIVADEAHLLHASGGLETLRLLLNLATEGGPSFTLLLVGQPTLLPILDRMPELDERLGVKCLLRPFRAEETAAYIAHRLKSAGARRAIFEPTAVEAVHYLSQGVPRRIDRLCDLTLLIGFAEERETLGCAEVESVASELMAISPE